MTLASPAPGTRPRSVVFGYHTMGCVGFDALLRHGFEIVTVFTHRDDPREEVWWESLAERARTRAIPVHLPEKAELKSAAVAELVSSCRPDFIFSFYYRFMIPTTILNLASKGAFNLHGSLLPRYRGRAPVNWVLVNGESETGVSLHTMVAKPDAGGLVDQERVAITFDDTALTLFRKLEAAAIVLLERALPALREGRAKAVPLDLAAGSYFGGRTPDDGRFAWHWPAQRIYNLVRAVTHPYPGAFTMLADRKLFVWWATPQPYRGAAAPGTVLALDERAADIATSDGALRLLKCQVEGGEENDAASVLRAHGIAAGALLAAIGEPA